MFVKSIVLDGFKSYGQRTEVSGFDEQFNAITGLNGSGKSNILDAICFVLGITNLSHVRAASLQDLIFKSGQGGINKATVSITFDNTNPAQCPPGFESYNEITVTRQIVLGGKNKYMINGSNVPNKKVQDLFCSIQLNVNNPHFLIMQGKITKVLNMKPPEILAMVEEAAGTRMYEVKRTAAQKLIEKKDEKLKELQSIFAEEVGPKLKKLREEREHYLEYQQVDRELEKLRALYQCWQYFEAKQSVANILVNLESVEKKIKDMEQNIENNQQKAQDLDQEIAEIASNKESEATIQLKEMESKLKQEGVELAKAKAALTALDGDITSEEKKKTQLQKSIKDDAKALQVKEKELSKVQSLFETLKQNDQKDNEAFALSQKRYEAVCAGMEVNEEGEAQTLQEQLIHAGEDAARADTENKQASMQLNFYQTQLKEKESLLGSNSQDYEKDKAHLKQKEKEVQTLEAKLGKLNFSEEKMNGLLQRRKELHNEIRYIRDKVQNFEARRPYMTFRYSDPEPNFNRRSVKGVVCRLIECEDPATCLALETAAGGRLYNVVVDTEVTSRKLLKNGNLQTRTTFIPLNQIRAQKMDNSVIRTAQQLVGEDNCKPAISLIKYDRDLQKAMEFIFGNVFICKDMNVAKQVTFHNRIKKKCVTLEGDVTDPSGTLSGGAPQKGGSMLLQLNEIQQLEGQLEAKERELQQVEGELRQLSGIQESYNSTKYQLDMALHEMELVKRRLQNTTHHRQQEEINNIKQQIDELQDRIKTSKEVFTKASKKAKELEAKMKNSKGSKEQLMKEAEKDMNACKLKADKSREEWTKRENEYETLNLEIAELKKGLEDTEQLIKEVDAAVENLKKQRVELTEGLDKIKGKMKEMENEVEKAKGVIMAKNKEIDAKNKKKEELFAQNNEFQVKIKEGSHEIRKLEETSKNCKNREKELSKKITDANPNLIKKAEELTHREGLELSSKIRYNEERKHKLGRTINPKAQSMFEEEDKQYNDLRKKEKIIINDKNKILSTMEDMDKKKEQSLKLAYQQVSKDFGSIFGTLLPGANARLTPPPGKTILQGLEVKVSLGGVWKESLTELSGGQRSLAALSLILAMLLFKPAPLYILDEVDAALDLSHTQNIGNMLKSHFKKSQFIIVSLKDGMFNNANVLYRTKFVDGVSMISRTVNRS